MALQFGDLIREAAETVSRGGVIAFRTDTFYGLGANPFNQEAVRKIKELKGREDNKPILIVISDYDQLGRFVSTISSTFKLLAERFWPGPLTLIGAARSKLPPEMTANTKLAQSIASISPTFHTLESLWPNEFTLIRGELPPEITAGTGTVGVRLPNDDRVRALVRACFGALTATSANPSHAAPATTALQVQEYFGSGVDLIVDDGEAQADRPSTVVDVSRDEPKLIREGVIPWGEITAVLTL